MKKTDTPREAAAQKMAERARKQKSTLGLNWLELHPEARIEANEYLDASDEYTECEPSLVGYLNYLNRDDWDDWGLTTPEWRQELIDDEALAASVWFIVCA